jgi:adenine-specific DNA-methyltransferase
MKTQRAKGKPISKTSADFLAERNAQLKALFPETFIEGKVSFDKLRESLGDLVDVGPERYTFTWAGKRAAIRLLQTPTRATLVPGREESVNFDTTQHLFIEGDNLEVLKLLYKSYFGRVKMIYIDPPYNTGNDFIYSDNYTDPLGAYLRHTGQADEAGNLLTSNPETGGRYHSAWLSMMYPRLFLARQLLREDGVIFVSIDDHEVHNLRLLMNEVFGEENFITTVIWQKVYSPKSSARHFSEDHDYVVVYARNAETWMPSLMPRTAEMDARYSNPDNDSRGSWKPSGLDARNYYSLGIYPIKCPSGRVIPGPPSGSYWRVSEEKFKELDRDKRIWWGQDGNSVPAIKRFLSEVKPGKVPQTLWTYKEVGHTQEAKKTLLELVKFENTDNVLDTVKPVRLIRRMLQVATDGENGDIVLDFFAGGATTAQAVLQQNQEDGGNRQFILAQLPEPLPKPETKLKTIADIGKERIRRVIDVMEEHNEGKLDLHPNEDLGVKVFRLAESNFRSWKGVDEETPEDYTQQMAIFTDPLMDNWEVENVIYEVALKEGYGLNCHIESLTDTADNTIYRVTDPDKEQSFYICLDNSLQPETLRALNLNKDDLFICRDVALDDEAAANLALQCRLKSI